MICDAFRRESKASSLLEDIDVEEEDSDSGSESDEEQVE
jgi:hypothetical protein